MKDKSEKPTLRNLRMIESLAAATQKRMNKVRKPNLDLLKEAAGQTVARTNPTETAVSMERHKKAMDRANDNRGRER